MALWINGARHSWFEGSFFEILGVFVGCLCSFGSFVFFFRVGWYWAVFSAIVQIEANGKLEVQLNSATLVGALEGVPGLNVYFGSVESAASGIEIPGLVAFLDRPVQRSFGFAPSLDASQTLLDRENTRSRRGRRCRRESLAQPSLPVRFGRNGRRRGRRLVEI